MAALSWAQDGFSGEEVSHGSDCTRKPPGSLLMPCNEGVQLQMSENRDGIFSKDNASWHLQSALTNTVNWQNENSSKCHSMLITFKCKSKGTRLRRVIFNNTSSLAIKIFICHHLIDLCLFQLFVYFMLITFLGQWEQVAGNLHFFLY